ncbi:MAG: HAD-IIIA family hydrolase [Sphaerochaetaceae bacterium]|nr:HAD-IIIA family hydrolase [Sphaerochaetaceae bacterium]
MKTIIVAGGKGTRISSIANDIPKPMIRIGGKPILELEIECLKSQGFTDIIITISHLGSAITSYFGDGRKLGVNIEYFNEEIPLGNAGALFKIKDKLSEDFLLINGDILFNVDLNRFIDFHRNHFGLASIFTHPNNHPYDSGLIISNDNNIVEKWLSKNDTRPHWYKNMTNAGLHILSPKILDQTIKSDKVDLDLQILKPLAGTGLLYSYNSPEYVKDMGTPERYELVRMDFKAGIIAAKNLKNKQHTIFLDRDGTINKYVGFLSNIDDFQLLPETAEAIKLINKSKYLCIVVTNQPIIARGDATWQQLYDIHSKMETLLGEEGAYVDAIYICPHHPDTGFYGEVKEYKIDCNCRKPKPGMLLKAAEDYNIDLSQSWMIGDSKNDMLAGEAANCKCIQVDENNSLLDAVKKILIVN